MCIPNEENQPRLPVPTVAARLIAQARRLLSFAGLGTKCPDPIARLIASAPRSESEAAHPDPARCLVAFCLNAIEVHPTQMSAGQYAELEALARFWLDYVPRWSCSYRDEVQRQAIARLYRASREHPAA